LTEGQPSGIVVGATSPRTGDPVSKLGQSERSEKPNIKIKPSSRISIQTPGELWRFVLSKETLTPAEREQVIAATIEISD
jgi:hypothetical protein